MYVGVPVGYLILSVLYLAVSDSLLLALTTDPEVLLYLSFSKGFIFVGLTAVLLFWMLRTYTLRVRHEEARAIEIYHSLIVSSNHLLRNFLNQTQIVQLELEIREQPLSDKASKLISAAIGTIVSQLDELTQIEEISAAAINEVAFRGLSTGVIPERLADRISEKFPELGPEAIPLRASS